MKTLTLEWLELKNACSEGIDWFLKQEESNVEKILEKLEEENITQYQNWLITNLLNKKNNVRYAVFAVKQVLSIFEDKYPDDKRLRKAIQVAEKYIEDDASAAAASAADAAYVAYAAADADDAAYAAAYAAYASAAADDDDDAAYAAYAAYAADAAYAAADAKKELYKKVFDYGKSLFYLQKERKSHA